MVAFNSQKETAFGYFYALVNNSPDDEPVTPPDGIPVTCSPLKVFDSSDNANPMVFNLTFDPPCAACGEADIFVDAWLDVLGFDHQPLFAQELTFASYDGSLPNCLGSWAVAYDENLNFYSSPLKPLAGSPNMCVVDWLGVFQSTFDYNDPTFRVIYLLEPNLIANPPTTIYVDDADKAVVDHIITIDELTHPLFVIKDFDVEDKYDALSNPVAAEKNEYKATIVLEEGIYNNVFDITGNGADSQSTGETCSFPDQVELVLGTGWTDINPPTDECIKVCTRVGSAGGNPQTATYICDDDYVVGGSPADNRGALSLDDVGNCGIENANDFTMELSVRVTFDQDFPSVTSPTELAYCFHEGLTFGYGTGECQVTIDPRPMVLDLDYTLCVVKQKTVQGDTVGQELTQLIVAMEEEPGAEMEACPGFEPTAKMVIPISITGFSADKLDKLIGVEGLDAPGPYSTGEQDAFFAMLPVKTVNGDDVELVEDSVEYPCNNQDNVICFKIRTLTCQPVTPNPDGTCAFTHEGFADIEVETCCEIAELKRTVVPEQDDYPEDECPTPDDKVVVTPDFDVEFIGTCPTANPNTDDLYLNDDIVLEVSIAGRPGDDDDISVTLTIDEIFMTLYDSEGAFAGSFPFSRQAKSQLMDNRASSYSYDAHFCRTAPTWDNVANTPNTLSIVPGFANPPTGNNFCLPFYRVGKNYGGIGNDYQNTVTGTTGSWTSDYTDDNKGYTECQHIGQRNVDRFVFIPNEWVYDRMEDLSGTLNVTVVATLTGCTTPDLDRRRLRDGDRELQDGGVPQVIEVSRSFTIINDDNIANCAGKAKSACKPKNGCFWAKYDADGVKADSTGMCTTEATLNTYSCTSLFNDGACKKHAGCAWSGNQCITKPTQCSDHTVKKPCNKANFGGKCAWFNQQCMLQSEVLSQPCSSYPKGQMCKKSTSKCKIQNNKCVDDAAAQAVTTCEDYPSNVKDAKKKCNRDVFKVDAGGCVHVPGSGNFCQALDDVECAGQSKNVCKGALARKCKWKSVNGAPKACVEKSSN
ncbi:Uncharacterized protein SCF082_LOCUS44954 [Durusdinium trenchii]|uniref:Uncharacterized protein n=1 Tax=Durusdinium trenchii TaxID=1381693 RepID=A0ABP0R6D0_9DINO